MNVEFSVSRNIHDYKNVMEGLSDDFGYMFYHSILVWCGILDDFDRKTLWQIYLIKSNGVVVGFCGLYSQYPKDYTELWLGWFGIVPKLRSMGIGTKALDFMSAEAKKFGCKKLMSYVDKEGKPLPFYYRYGFKPAGTVREYMDQHRDLSKYCFEDEDDFVIEKEIS